MKHKRDWKPVKILQRDKAIPWKNDKTGVWFVLISCYVGNTGFCGDILIPFGYDSEEIVKGICETFNKGAPGQ